MKRLGILGSTRGTAMLDVMSAIKHKQLAADIAVVLSNKADAPILTKAKDYGCAYEFVDPTNLTPAQYDAILTQKSHDAQVDLVVLIGYMRILSNEFVTQWQHKVINVHPSLLPAFAGKMNLDVHQAVLDAKVKETGCTVHYVTEAVDAGPIILQEKCMVLPFDTVEQLKARVQALEGGALVTAIHNIFNGLTHEST